jgi:hypothetical protein
LQLLPSGQYCACCVRDLLIRQRTQATNALRTHLAELGIVAPQGYHGLKSLLAINADSKDARLPENARVSLSALVAQVSSCQAEIVAISDDSKRLETIPGIGLIGTSAIVATVLDAWNFQTGAPLRPGLASSHAKIRPAANGVWAPFRNNRAPSIHGTLQMSRFCQGQRRVGGRDGCAVSELLARAIRDYDPLGASHENSILTGWSKSPATWVGSTLPSSVQNGLCHHDEVVLAAGISEGGPGGPDVRGQFVRRALLAATPSLAWSGSGSRHGYLPPF